MTPAPLLTTTELETLATMLGSASRHMAHAMFDGKYVWAGDVARQAVSDMDTEFYQIQFRGQKAAGILGPIVYV